MTEEQYLAIERAAETKSEFLNCEMFAMAGGSTAPSRLQGDLFVAGSIPLAEIYRRVKFGT